MCYYCCTRSNVIITKYNITLLNLARTAEVSQQQQHQYQHSNMDDIIGFRPQGSRPLPHQLHRIRPMDVEEGKEAEAEAEAETEEEEEEENQEQQIMMSSDSMSEEDHRGVADIQEGDEEDDEQEVLKGEDVNMTTTELVVMTKIIDGYAPSVAKATGHSDLEDEEKEEEDEKPKNKSVKESKHVEEADEEEDDDEKPKKKAVKENTNVEEVEEENNEDSKKLDV